MCTNTTGKSKRQGCIYHLSKNMLPGSGSIVYEYVRRSTNQTLHLLAFESWCLEAGYECASCQNAPHLPFPSTTTTTTTTPPTHTHTHTNRFDVSSKTENPLMRPDLHYPSGVSCGSLSTITTGTQKRNVFLILKVGTWQKVCVGHGAFQIW